MDVLAAVLKAIGGALERCLETKIGRAEYNNPGILFHPFKKDLMSALVPPPLQLGDASCQSSRALAGGLIQCDLRVGASRWVFVVDFRSGS